MPALMLVALLHAAPPTFALTAVLEITAVNGSRGHGTPISTQLALTALHVVEGGGDIRWRQGFTEGTASVISQVKGKDVAVLKVADGQAFPFSVVVAKERPALMDEVFYVAPDWEGSKGMVRGELVFRYPDERWGVLPFAWFGMSGGGVFNRRGELIGLLSQISRGVAHPKVGAPMFSIPVAVMVEVKGVR